MGQFLLRRSRWVLASLLVFLASRAPAQQPIDDLRRALQRGGADSTGPEALEFRRTKIREAIGRMKTIGELRRALTLDEWTSDPVRGALVEGIHNIDVAERRALGERLAKAFAAMAEKGDATSRLAVANLIAELGPTIRAVDPGDRAGYTRTLTPLIARLCEDPDIGVRQEALRALGNINPPAKEATEVFRKTLEKDAAVGPRRLAADGLEQMIKVVSHLQKRGQTATGVDATRKDLFDVLVAVAAATSAGLEDADSEVRMLVLQAVQTAAQSLAELLEIPEGALRKNFPPTGRKLTPVERARILDTYRQLQEDYAQVKPLFDGFAREVPKWSRGLYDPDARVRLAAIQAFENLGNARLRLVRRANALPSIKDLKEGTTKTPQELLKDADFLEPYMTKDLDQVQVLLKDPDVRIRRSAAEALEVLEDRALPCLPGLIGALKDADRFVRWTAAKAIGTLPADKVADAVLPLSVLLNDQDLNLRIAAATALEAMGPTAAAAVPALAKSIRDGDVEARLAAMYAIMRVGPENAIAAIPALIVALESHDPRVIRTACEALAYIGPPAAEALPVLRRLIGHDDPEVRAWASDAILSIKRIEE